MIRPLCFAALALMVSVAAACPFGWSQSGSSCYKISNRADTYNNAAYACSQHSSCASGFGGNLVSITTDFENQQVMDILTFNNMVQREVWLGLRTTNGPLRWASGEFLNAGLRNPWHERNPMRGPNMCTVAFNNRWATRNCNEQRFYICEMAGEAPPPAFYQENPATATETEEPSP